MSDDEPIVEPPAPSEPPEPGELSEPASPSGGLWEKLKERRITQLVIAYLAGGWVALAGVDQLVDRQVLPELVYRIALVLFVGGLGIALILGWYHGEKGRQRVTLPEVILLGIVSLVTLGSSVLVANRFLEGELDVGTIDLGPDTRRVAVMYFQDRTGDTELSYLSDALTEALIDELARIPVLDVISRNGVAPFRDGNAAPEVVGRELNAGSVIDGSVEATRGGLRVNVQLLDGVSGANVDRAVFTLPSDDLLAVRDSVVQMASRFLRTTLGEEVRVRDQRAAAETVEGWTLYQRAERLRREAGEVEGHDRHEALNLLARADSLLASAEALEPRWGDPPALRAEVALRQGAWGARSPSEALAAIERGVDHADRALAIQPRHARALEARGNLYRFHHFLNVSPSQTERARLLDQAERDIRAAIDADPGLASAHAILSRLLYDRRDRIGVALAAREALRADAYLADADLVIDRLFLASYDLAQFTEARLACQEGATRFPEDPAFVRCRLLLMLAPVTDPDPAAAWELVARGDSILPPGRQEFEGRLNRMIAGGVLARAGLADSARAVLQRARAGPEVDPDQDLVGYEAVMRIRLGDYDEAIRRLRLYLTGNPEHQAGMQVEGDLHWWWRPLRDHPEFATLLRPGGPSSH
jgi:TolB-like protein/tetratricopeptide (TPR) repeat protein